MADESKEKKGRTRSPAYPAIDLEDAIVKADAMWKKANRHSVPVDVVGTYWGYESKSSAASSASSAMKKFGLLVEEGSKDKRSLKLSDLAIKLIYNPDTNSLDYAAALKEAALQPVIHAELWTKYGGSLPDDAVIKRYLVVDRKFNDGYVESFIAEFRKTIGFAKLQPSDTVRRENEENGQTIKLPATPASVMQPMPPGVVHHAPALAPAVSPSSAKELALPLESGQVIKLPIPMTEEDYRLLVETLQLWKRRIVAMPAPAKSGPPDGE